MPWIAWSKPSIKHWKIRRDIASMKPSIVHAFLLLATFAASPVPAGESPPNILLFIADDVSHDDLGCYGHPTVETPTIDRLAAEGLRFTEAYLTTSSCSPSRCSILTGRYPHNTGAPELHTSLPEDQIRFPEILRQAGYHTALAGKNHMVKRPDRAFDLIVTGKAPALTSEWVRLVQERPRKKPFFFWFASVDAHRDWQITEDVRTYDPDEAVVPPYLIDGPMTRADLAHYYHEVSRFDHDIGKVVAELERQGVLDETLILVMADNGRPFPRCKTRLYDSGIKTPLVLRHPGLIPNPAVSASLVSVIDLAATILDVAGLEPAPSVQGRSLRPLFSDPSATIRETAFAEHNWHVFQNHERMVRFGDFLYIRNHFPERMNLCIEAYGFDSGVELWKVHAAGKTTPAQQGLFAEPAPPEELFRVSKDPHQLQNLVANPEYAEILGQARRKLDDWMTRTGDTIPKNPTRDRDVRPRIENGLFIPSSGRIDGWKRGEMPGTPGL